ncbi:formylglycine-generating enzyme family protein [Luteipulveratus flavus]|uniref:SUMF1/EgtB/PvdO family nonheme iron enzyme n=1 Tax=Luteipulveratus flavus TaxID=3031728 RepID=A0ABT6C4Q3_9MICO|nr:SUMF1/EgtB/PvdO family nonheme iron enzyme [Luteipulveratus sp. YIM 133296]MDF8263282.1 SUMF1/EgtB/PvdO family nonheme iron enzyme [Luteipulveratus sp. YIM 133296]
MTDRSTTSRAAAAVPTVIVPSGRVQLHDRRTQERWDVDVAPFRLGTTAVTQEQYAAVTGHPPSVATGDGLPVESVSWEDAVAFCNALSEQEGVTPAYDLAAGPGGVVPVPGSLGYRLPTEAEWEHACRAGTVGPRYGDIDEIAWYEGNSGDRIHPVGTRVPNPWGLHDMLGNVWEWCWDLYDPDVYGSYRVLRGGGWSDPHWSVRAGVRRRSHPTYRIDDVGFRVATSKD